MEPVTHVLTGACLSRAGFNRRAAYATLTMAIAAEMPDLDTVWSWFGPVEGFAHHRGITHTFVAMPVEAAILVGAVYLLHRWRRARASRTRIGPNFSAKPLTKAPVRWWTLYGCALVGLLSHLLLDYTNNYGLRPFYPFNPHWYAASIAFIFDPFIFLLLAFALVLPSLFGLVSAEVGARAKPFRGRGMAIVALLCIVAWWGLRLIEHHKAVQIGMQQTYDQQQLPVDVVVARRAVDAAAPATSETELIQPPSQLLPAQRVQASPNPLDPFLWAVTIDYGPLYQLASVNARTAAVKFSDVTYPKLPEDAVIRAARQSPLGRVYLDWSSMPIITEDAPVEGSSGNPTRKIVFRDPRFMGDISWLRLSQEIPLTAVVTVNNNGDVLRESIDGRREAPGRGPVYDASLAWPVSGSGAAPEPRPAPGIRPKPAPAPTQHTAVLPNLDLPMTETAKAPQPAVAAAPAPRYEASPPPLPVAPPRPEPAKAVAPPPVVPTPAPSTQAAATPTIPSAEPHKSALEKPQPPPPAPAATAPEPTGPGVFERGYDSAKAKAARFRNWLHWLANGD